MNSKTRLKIANLERLAMIVLPHISKDDKYMSALLYQISELVTLANPDMDSTYNMLELNLKIKFGGTLNEISNAT